MSLTQTTVGYWAVHEGMCVYVLFYLYIYMKKEKKRKHDNRTVMYMHMTVL